LYKIIKDSLDPKKGIPLFFIDNYLKDIAVRANNLLSIAYGDAFKIKFDISASDFFINVFKSDGTFLSDIKQASQGETSLTTVSLSLGMIERMMNTTKYDIIYLDEIDSTLSTKNRRLFITLLENQLEKLGIEQVFVISHNNEFESHPTDMILLKENNIDTDDKEFMQNKNIIFKY
jgi:DNA repair exonuclease SbcCD ATPase subunit